MQDDMTAVGGVITGKRGEYEHENDDGGMYYFLTPHEENTAYTYTYLHFLIVASYGILETGFCQTKKSNVRSRAKEKEGSAIFLTVTMTMMMEESNAQSFRRQDLHSLLLRCQNGGKRRI